MLVLLWSEEDPNWKPQITTVAEKYKPPLLADFPSLVIFLLCARNFLAPQDKS